MDTLFRTAALLGLSSLVSLSAAAEPPEPRPLARDLLAYAAPADAEATPELPVEPSGALTLADALAAALARSPSLAAFSWEVRAREAALVQAHARPNPELRAELEDFAGSGRVSAFDAAQTTLSLSQLLELGGKRERRVERSALERDLAGWDYEAGRLSVAAGTAAAFFEVLAAQQRLALAAESQAIAERSVREIEAEVRAGATSPVVEARARVELERVEIEHGALASHLDTARSLLAAHWAAREARFERAVGDLRTLVPPPPFGALLPRLEEGPALARFATELAARRAALAVEQAGRTPDVRVGLGGRHYADGGDAALVAELSLPLPLVDRRRGSLLEARYRLRRAEAERQAAALAVGSAVRMAHARMLRAYEEARALREGALPHAERAFRGSEAAWRSGALRYTEVLDVQRTLFGLRGEEIDALAEYHIGRAELEGLVGIPIAAEEGPL